MNMRYTIAALADNEEIIEIMWDGLIAMGAPSGSIAIKSGIPGVSQPQISVHTSDLTASEAYLDKLTSLGGILVRSSEESSSLDAIR